VRDLSVIGVNRSKVKGSNQMSNYVQANVVKGGQIVYGTHLHYMTWGIPVFWGLVFVPNTPVLRITRRFVTANSEV
jgi:hypothetical protein